ncbi:Alpha-1,3-mannosyltransferase-like protein [Savitreella phatthalungensis]
MKIAFIHPDLGIGGAERLVVDAAVGLQELGHSVVIYTSYRDRDHCFPEARDGTLEVRVRGDTVVPANIAGKLSILCAMLRQLHLAVSLLGDQEEYDVVFADQLSVAIPLLKMRRPNLKVLFYCHFPDKLLSTRASLLKSLYRVPFDYIEEKTTDAADRIVVNSRFTASVFRRAFTRIRRVPAVVYPCVDVTQKFDGTGLRNEKQVPIALSINRFERKKDVALAIKAFARLSSDAMLIVAGGHDVRVAENVATLKALEGLCDQLGLAYRTINGAEVGPGTDVSTMRPDGAKTGSVAVVFVLSVPDAAKRALLAHARILLYTPANEHFGIVPLEAALAECPTLAQNNGGPLETVIDGETGYLRPGDADAWAKVLSDVLSGVEGAKKAKELGQAARKIVVQKFAREAMARGIETHFNELLGQRQESSSSGNADKSGGDKISDSTTKKPIPMPKTREFTQATEQLDMQTVMMLTLTSVIVALFCIASLYLGNKYLPDWLK